MSSPQPASFRARAWPFEFPSVGATENLMMAAVLAQGESVLENCAREPEIVDLARALRAMGAELEGEGTEVIRIQGKPSLSGCDYEVMGDRIEAGTFLAAGLATGGSVRVEGLDPVFLEAVLVKFEDAGAKVVRGQRVYRDILPGASAWHGYDHPSVSWLSYRYAGPVHVRHGRGRRSLAHQ